MDKIARAILWDRKKCANRVIQLAITCYHVKSLSYTLANIFKESKEAFFSFVLTHTFGKALVVAIFMKIIFCSTVYYITYIAY